MTPRPPTHREPTDEEMQRLPEKALRYRSFVQRWEPSDLTKTDIRGLDKTKYAVPITKQENWLASRVTNRNLTISFIYTDEELPPKHIPVLVLAPQADSPIWIASFTDIGWIYTGETEPIRIPVIAWAEIPSAPMTYLEAHEARSKESLTDAMLAARNNQPEKV